MNNQLARKALCLSISMVLMLPEVALAQTGAGGHNAANSGLPGVASIGTSPVQMQGSDLRKEMRARIRAEREAHKAERAARKAQKKQEAKEARNKKNDRNDQVITPVAIEPKSQNSAQQNILANVTPEVLQAQLAEKLKAQEAAAREAELRAEQLRQDGERLQQQMDRLAAKAAAKAKEEADTKERKEREIAERKAREEAARLKAEKERLEKIEAAKRAAAEEQAQIKADAEFKAQLELRLKANLEAEKKVAAEAERIRKDNERTVQALKQAQEEAVRKAEADRLAKLEAVRKAEEARLAKLEEERQAKAVQERRAEEARLAKLEEERQAKAEQERRAEEARQAKFEQDLRIREEAERQKNERVRLAEEARQAKAEQVARLKAEKQKALREAQEEAQRQKEAAMQIQAKANNEPVVFNALQRTMPAIPPASDAQPTYVVRGSQSALQVATAKIAGVHQSPLRAQYLGYTATDAQLRDLHIRTKYDASRLSILPKAVGEIKLLPVARLAGDTILMYRSAEDKKLVEEFMSYYPLHAQVFGNYIKRVITLRDGKTEEVTIDRALMEELTYDISVSQVPSSRISNAQDTYLYFSSRLSDEDQVKFWNWVNAVKQNDEVRVPSWVRLGDVIYSQQ